MAEYARRAKDTTLTGYANEIRARAERKAGEMLKAMDKAKGAREPKTRRGTITEPREIPTLADQGITKRQSSAWQNVTATPINTHNGKK